MVTSSTPKLELAPTDLELAKDDFNDDQYAPYLSLCARPGYKFWMCVSRS